MSQGTDSQPHWYVADVNPKFEKMFGMDYSCPRIGDVRLMVGVRRQDKMKVQYCITALTPLMKNRKKNQGSLK